MIHFALYEPATQLVVSIASTAAMTWPQVQAFWPRKPDQALIETPGQIVAADWHVVGGILRERAAMTPVVSKSELAANGLDEVTITGLPSPCTIRVEGAVTAGPVELTGGVLTLTSTTPGAINVIATRDPDFKLWKATIHAT